MRLSWLKSKTVWGAIVAGVGILTDPAVFALLPREITGPIVVAGAILKVIGERAAIAKNGTGR